MLKPHAVAHILYVQGADPGRDRVVLDVGGVRTIIVVVPEPEQAPPMAARYGA